MCLCNGRDVSSARKITCRSLDAWTCLVPWALQLFLDHWDTQDLHCSPGHFGWFGTAGRLTAACLHSRRFCLKVLPSVILWKTRSLLATCDIRNVGQTAKSSGSHEVAEKPGMLFGMELHDQVRICGTLLLNRHHHGSRILCRCVCNQLHVTHLLFTDVKLQVERNQRQYNARLFVLPGTFAPPLLGLLVRHTLARRYIARMPLTGSL